MEFLGKQDGVGLPLTGVAWHGMYQQMAQTSVGYGQGREFGRYPARPARGPDEPGGWSNRTERRHKGILHGGSISVGGSVVVGGGTAGQGRARQGKGRAQSGLLADYQTGEVGKRREENSQKRARKGERAMGGRRSGSIEEEGGIGVEVHG